MRATSSAVEHSLHTGVVTGSIPVSPTILPFAEYGFFGGRPCTKSADVSPVQSHVNSTQRCRGQLLKLDQHQTGCQRDVVERVDV